MSTTTPARRSQMVAGHRHHVHTPDPVPPAPERSNARSPRNPPPWLQGNGLPAIPQGVDGVPGGWVA